MRNPMEKSFKNRREWEESRGYDERRFGPPQEWQRWNENTPWNGNEWYAVSPEYWREAQPWNWRGGEGGWRDQSSSSWQPSYLSRNWAPSPRRFDNAGDEMRFFFERMRDLWNQN